MDCDAYRDRMLDVLYGEAGDAERRAVEEHQAACASCREELAAFRRVRRELSAWKLPVPARARAGIRVWPGLAAAAVVILALGAVAASGGAELRRDAQGWTLRLGRGASSGLEARLAEQDARHRAEIAQLRASLVRTPEAPGSGEALAAVREIVRQSEARQDARLQDAVSQLSDRVETQRRYDLAQVSAGLSYLEGKAGLHAARTNELVGQVLLASQER